MDILAGPNGGTPAPRKRLHPFRTGDVMTQERLEGVVTNCQASASAHEEVVRGHYNRLAPSYAEYWQGETPLSWFFNDRKRRVLDLLSDLRHGQLLEVGCGPGMMAGPLIERGFQYTGADLSDGMIAECRRRLGGDPRADFVVASAENLPFRDQSFQVVLCLGALEYLNDPGKAVQEAARALEPGGVFLFSMLNRSSPYRLAQRLYRPGKLPCKHFTERFAKEVLANHGFLPTDCVYFDFNIVPPPIDERLPRATRLLRACVGYACPRFLQRWLGSVFLIKAVREAGR